MSICFYLWPISQLVSQFLPPPPPPPPPTSSVLWVKWTSPRLGLQAAEESRQLGRGSHQLACMPSDLSDTLWSPVHVKFSSLEGVCNIHVVEGWYATMQLNQTSKQFKILFFTHFKGESMRLFSGKQNGNSTVKQEWKLAIDRLYCVQPDHIYIWTQRAQHLAHLLPIPISSY